MTVAAAHGWLCAVGVPSYKRNPLVDSDFMAVPFTYDVPALKQILKSTQVYTKQPTWYPNKPSKP